MYFAEENHMNEIFLSQKARNIRNSKGHDKQNGINGNTNFLIIFFSPLISVTNRITAHFYRVTWDVMLNMWNWQHVAIMWRNFASSVTWMNAFSVSFHFYWMQKGSFFPCVCALFASRSNQIPHSYKYYSLNALLVKKKIHISVLICGCC